jgi:hypothetical protein
MSRRTLAGPARWTSTLAALSMALIVSEKLRADERGHPGAIARIVDEERSRLERDISALLSRHQIETVSRISDEFDARFRELEAELEAERARSRELASRVSELAAILDERADAATAGYEPASAFLGVVYSPVVGVDVLDVRPGSPADVAGLLPGDRLLTVNDRSVDPENLGTVLSLSMPGSLVRLTWTRDEHEFDETARLADRTTFEDASSPADDVDESSSALEDIAVESSPAPSIDVADPDVAVEAATARSEEASPAPTTFDEIDEIEALDQIEAIDETEGSERAESTSADSAPSAQPLAPRKSLDAIRAEIDQALDPLERFLRGVLPGASSPEPASSTQAPATSEESETPPAPVPNATLELPERPADDTIGLGTSACAYERLVVGPVVTSHSLFGR